MSDQQPGPGGDASALPHGGNSDLAPGFLVSVPQMLDPNFDHTVVYLVAHGEEGAFGLTINRPGPLTLPEVGAEFGYTLAQDDDVFHGGPVESNRGFLLHGGQEAADGAETIEPGIHISGLPETLKRVSEDSRKFRLFLGYAGWGPGQLDAELAQGTWLCLPSDPHYIFDLNPIDIWDRVLRDAGYDPGMIAVPERGDLN